MSEEFERLASALSPRYRLDRQLDRGIVAQGYLADDRQKGRRVVVKILRPELAASVNEDRFRREIAVSAQLQHPNIAPIVEFDEVDGRPYYVMPVIDGESLRTRLSRVKRLSVSEALRIIEDIARALDFARRRNVVHRDLKPENIVLRGERAVLLDFGIALALDTTGPRRPHPRFTLATADYTTSEQLAGEPEVGGRGDICSLACAAYEMLCGRPPFVGTPISVMSGHAPVEAGSLADRCPEVPPAISSVLSRALSTVPAERLATASELLVALRHAAQDARPVAPRIAVLSFVHAGDEATVDAFSERITEQLIYALNDMGGLEVSARSTLPVGRTKLHVSRVARQLEADVLVFATVRETTGGVHLAATVLHANGSHLWSRTFTARENDVVYVIRELADQLAHTIRPAVSAAPTSGAARMSAAS